MIACVGEAGAAVTAHGSSRIDVELLRERLLRWKAGEATALELALQSVMPWLQRQVRAVLRPADRTDQESMDFAQQAVANFLRSGMCLDNIHGEKFLSLLRTIAINEVKDARRRRSLLGPAGRPPGTIDGGSDLSSWAVAASSKLGPDREAQTSEERNWVRLALQFLDAEERSHLIEAELGSLSWSELAHCWNMASEDAARAHCARVRQKLVLQLARLRRGLVPPEPKYD